MFVNVNVIVVNVINTVNLCVLFDFDNEWYFLLYYNNYCDITKVEDRMIWVCLLSSIQ